MLVNTIVDNKKEHIDVYSDMPGFNINGGSLPPNIIVSNLNPDLVIVDKSQSPEEVVLYELTYPFDSPQNIQQANSYKKDKYQSLKSDIEENGFTCHVIPFEIGARGFIPRRVKLILYSLLRSTTSIKYPTEHIIKLSKISLLCSFSIFHSRREKTWSDPCLLYTSPSPRD